MTIADRWLLPDGMDEVLPPQASRMEELRRALLDLFHLWGYDQVMPPPVEFLDSLLTGTGTDLDLQTFKLTDQLTGRMMGVTADVTPQVARIDAHSLKREGPVRLCYCTNVLRAKADKHQGGRSPVQVGVELFGSASLAADLEILRLALESLEASGAGEVHLALGHVGIYRNLVEVAGLDAEAEYAISAALALKSPGQLEAEVARTVSDPALATMFRTLGELHGGPEVLDQAREAFAEAPQAVNDALDKLYDLYQGVQREHPEVDCYFDLAELRGYQYHTGMMFAAYVPGYGQALAKGGRYDDTGRAFGRARPATGFSMDLKLLATLATKDPAGDSVWAPADEGAPGLDEAVQKLRRQGRRVIQGLPGQRAPGHDCSEQLVARGQEWVLEPLTT
ncbi:MULTISPECIES: ATP phosphoribosyltransferase regulatory subunit [Halomonas]|uniref:ATP phosphoribosyltransferase regulatory subunit n=1 Tax=Halomonas TaxID=2745 RepID=UPI001C946CA8|nr:MULTISPECIES: ATP phosphoribosyltransferase regulatory subunit [Halomonas]MBY5924365.1 ATP phosphoribosyltransferase regulatory subunit [Halomonas sp. DP4Y7-2]MBY5929925.1 ATP phosphoribosyltransferase regulatory subunit [Halomonas sp. DP8Y7-3]MBY5968328.1 ATP phosphoribosyltransferase regulatory subunit [Halomonas denitrificans]MBY5984298.1 ATP phosphoribosyltransferase regulatory subunit [Halomonas sp. DP5Y7-2]MBY6028127.1 ATP phosphoribosyltransferase regulatory subunit [Halomonas sp. DP